jgi:hypothetical protein
VPEGGLSGNLIAKSIFGFGIVPASIRSAAENGFTQAVTGAENIGVEKVVLNLLTNPRIRWLVICGTEAKGHRAGDAFLRLKERGGPRARERGCLPQLLGELGKTVLLPQVSGAVDSTD